MIEPPSNSIVLPAKIPSIVLFVKESTQVALYSVNEPSVVLSVMQVSHCAEVDPRWTHEYVPSAAAYGNLWHAKKFLKELPKVDIHKYSCVHRVSISGQCDATLKMDARMCSRSSTICLKSLFVSPPAVNIGTV